MPTPSELTKEELEEFAQHGVLLNDPPAEPVVEEGAPAEPVVEEGAPAEPVVEPPASAEPVVEDPAATPPPGFVPHQALHAEREARKQLAQQMAQLQARTNAVLAAQPVVTSLDLPDLDVDPVGYVRGLEQSMQNIQQEREQEAHIQQVDAAFQQDEVHFQSYTPDYEQAATHFANSRAQELSTLYPPQQVRQIMINETRDMAKAAWQRGIPAAQMVYQMAQARGYAAPVAGAPAAQAPSPAAVVAAATTGQQAVRTLSVGSGAATPTQMNADALLAMSDDEFEAYLKLGTKGANARFAAIG